jgi:hypothetical protein
MFGARREVEQRARFGPAFHDPLPGWQQISDVGRLAGIAKG